MYGKANKAINLTKVSLNTLNLANKKIVVVGGTDGLGRSIARQCSETHRADVSVVGRTNREESTSKIKFLKADLSLVTEAERIANEIPLDTDTLILTTGIIAAPTRQVSQEGIELDMAISTLSRHVILKQYFNRFGGGDSTPSSTSSSSSSTLNIPRTKVFVMGFPGSDQTPPYDDLNSEKKKYSPFSTHSLTVGGNEVLVHYYAKLGYSIYGLNPGLVKTNIRGNYYTTSFGKSMVETLIGMFTPTSDQYATSIVPVLFATDIEKYKGSHYNQKGDAILPSTKMNDDAYVTGYFNAMDALMQRAKQTHK